MGLEYRKAALYYEKALCFGEGIKETILFKKSLCYKEIADFAASFSALGRIDESKIDTGFRDTLHYQKALLLGLMDRPAEGLALLRPIKSDKGALSLAAGELEIILLSQDGQYDEAIRLLQQAGYPEAQKIKPPKIKKPELARSLSFVFPGAGQLYAGYPLDASASLLLQAGAFYLGYRWFLQEYYLSCLLTTLPVFGELYFGGSRHAEHLAKEKNLKRHTAFNILIINILRH